MSINKLNSRLLIFIGIGGAIGALVRYSVSFFILTDGFPFSTLLVNLLGCLLLAFISTNLYFKKVMSAPLFTAISSGFLGSFTTFSTFAVETVSLWETHYFIAFIYVALSIIGGLFFCYIGYQLARFQEKVRKS